MLHPLESPHKSVLRHLPNIRRVAAKLRHKGVDTPFVAINQLLKRLQRAGLRPAGQLFVRDGWKFLNQLFSISAMNGAALLLRLFLRLRRRFPRGIGLHYGHHSAGGQHQLAHHAGAILRDRQGIGNRD